MQSVEFCPDRDVDVAACTARLTACRQDVMTRYTGFLEALHVVRTHSMALTKALEAMSASCLELANTGGVIRALWEQTQSVADALEGALTMIEAEGSRKKFIAVGNAVSRLQPRARQLSAVASLTAVASAHLKTTDLSVHITLMRNLASSLKNNSEVMVGCVENIETATRAAGERLKRSCDVMTALQTDLEASVGKSSDSRRLADIGENAVQTSDALLQTTKARLRDLISCMQFSDAFVQRIDHVVEMLEDEMRGAGAIANAQMIAMIADLADNFTQAHSAIDGLCKVSESAGSILGHDESDARTAISECQKALAIAKDTSGEIKCATADILEQLGRIGPATEQAQKECAALHDTFRQMSLSANNVSFKARAQDQEGKAMTTLAREVQEIAAHTGGNVEDVKAGIDSFRSISKHAALDALLGSVDAFQETAAQCNELFEAIQALFAQKQTIAEQSGELRGSIDTARSLLADLSTIDDQLVAEQPFIAQLADTAVAPDDAENRKIYDLYTMEREREIHETVFPVVADENAAADACDIDDDGFETF